MKYFLNQQVFYIDGNKVCSAPVLSRCEVDNCLIEDQNYIFGDTRTMYATCHGKFHESNVFASKEELIASL
jgi:hypothetical protein